MGSRSSNNNKGFNNRSDGHLLNYLRNTFVRGGGSLPLTYRTYSVSPSTSSVNEGSTVTFTITTNYVDDGTILYWTLNTISGTINSSDFSGGATSGSFTVTGGTGSVALTLANDVTTEGSESFQLQVRIDSTSGTIVATSSTVTINDTSTAAIQATGGTVIDSGGFRTHVFTSPGSFVVSYAGPGTLDYYIVAGGGGGGTDRGGGGGSGGYRNGTFTGLSIGSYPVSVGGGGAAGSNPQGSTGSNGSQSSFDSIVSSGGGGGGGEFAFANSGGSGGGATFNSGYTTGASGNTPPTTPPQGNPGGNGVSSPRSTGGGGGAAGAGGSGSPGVSGTGGTGVALPWLMSPYGQLNPSNNIRYLAGGGGGGATNGDPGGSAGPGPGGIGGGGAGGNGPGTIPGTSGTTNTGGGGGGGGFDGTGTAGSGGSGIVAIRYPYP